MKVYFSLLGNSTGNLRTIHQPYPIQAIQYISIPNTTLKEYWTDWPSLSGPVVLSTATSHLKISHNCEQSGSFMQIESFVCICLFLIFKICIGVEWLKWWFAVLFGGRVYFFWKKMGTLSLNFLLFKLYFNKGDIKSCTPATRSYILLARDSPWLNILNHFGLQIKIYSSV